MKYPKPSVGDSVYIVPVGNIKGHPSKYDLVTKVGRVYFYVDNIKFHIDTWREKSFYSDNYKVYPSKKDRERYLALLNYESLFRGTFDGYGRKRFTLKQYKQCSEILGLDKEDK